MDRIDKSRKGVVYGMMTSEEQDCLKRQKNIITYDNEAWHPEYDHGFYSNMAYWCPDWDELTGEELVGKICVAWDIEGKNRIIGKVWEYTSGVYNIYGIKCEHARIANLSEIKVMINMEG